jgi:hypothetical protein
MDDDITRSILIRVNPDVEHSSFNGYWLSTAKPTYLQLETLVTHFSLRFRPEDSKSAFVYTNVIVINNRTSEKS